MQKTHWRSSTSCRKVWWLDNSRSQSSQWRMWIKRQSLVSCRGAGLGHPMDSILSVQKKTSQETHRSLRKFLEPNRKPKVIYTDNSLEFGKACEDLSWNHCSSTPHRSETHGIAERAVRRVKEGTFAVLLQSGLDENWWADSMECSTNLRSIQDLLSDGKITAFQHLIDPVDRNTSHVIFLLHSARCFMMCVTPHWLKCLHERVMSSSWSSMMCGWLIVCSLCSSPCSFPCVSPSSSLPTSTCTLSWTTFSTQRGVLPLGRIQSSHRWWAQPPWRLPLLGDYRNHLPEAIQRQRRVALVLARRGTRRWDHR